MVDDQHLAYAVKQGKQKSLSMLYDKYAPALMGVINRITRNEELAEEVLQITFARVWDQIDSFDSANTSLFSWLINLARNSAFAKIKPVELKNAVINKTVYEESINSSAKDHSFRGSGQTAFDLIYYKGLNCNEAAAALQISVEDLKKNIRMALKNRKEIKVV